MKQRKTPCFLIILLLCLLCGCRGQSSSDLFALPESVAELPQLNLLLNAEMEAGFEYCSPTAGEHRQPLLLADVDGDGQEEILAFLRNTATEICRIQIYKLYDEGYASVLSLEGEGSTLSEVDCADLNGDGVQELVAAWNVGAELNILYVYDLALWGGEVLLTDSCSEFLCFDLSGDGVQDLMAVTLEGRRSGVSVFSFPVLDDSAKLTAPLSKGIEEICRIRGCKLEGNTPALLVESYLESGELVSDLYSLLDGKLYNITLEQQSGVSRTKRSYAVLSADIDSDRFLEVPVPADLYAQNSGDHYRILSWVGFNRYGFSVIKQETYHCYVDGWYLVLPEGWSENLTVRRDDSVAGERCVILSSVDRETGEVSDYLKIYTLTGENRTESAKRLGRFVLSEDETTIYAAEILHGLTHAELMQRFHLIYAEWATGSL